MGGGGGVGGGDPGHPVCSSCHSPALRLPWALPVGLTPAWAWLWQAAVPHRPQSTPRGATPTPAATARRQGSGAALTAPLLRGCRQMGTRAEGAAAAAGSLTCSLVLDLAVVYGCDTKSTGKTRRQTNGTQQLKHLCSRDTGTEREGSISQPHSRSWLDARTPPLTQQPRSRTCPESLAGPEDTRAPVLTAAPPAATRRGPVSFKDEGERSRGVRRTRGPAPGAAGWTWGLCGGTAAHCSQRTQSEQGGPLYGELQPAMGVLETISQQCGGLSHLPSVTMENAVFNSVNESDRLGRNVTDRSGKGLVS